jgi:hypothetical protein
MSKIIKEVNWVLVEKLAWLIQVMILTVLMIFLILMTINNVFDYENINALYVNYNKQLKGLMIQFGVRAENTHSKEYHQDLKSKMVTPKFGFDF